MTSDELIQKLLDKITCKSPHHDVTRLERDTAVVCTNGHARCSRCEEATCQQPCRALKGCKDVGKNVLLREIIDILANCREQCTFCKKWVREDITMHKVVCSSRTVTCGLCPQTFMVKHLVPHVQHVHNTQVVNPNTYIPSVQRNTNTFVILKDNQTFFIEEIRNQQGSFEVRSTWIPNEPNPNHIFKLGVDFDSDKSNFSPLKSAEVMLFKYQKIRENRTYRQCLKFPLGQSVVNHHYKHRIVLTVKRYSESGRDSESSGRDEDIKREVKNEN